MERLFSLCTRLRDIENLRPPRGLQELSLDVSTEAFLSNESAFTYADLHALLGDENMVVWLTPHAAVARPYGRVAQSWGHVQGSCRIRFNVDGNDIKALARSPEHLLEICDVVVRLLAASVVHSVVLDKWGSRNVRALINAASLAHLMEQCQSLKALKLQHLALDESQIRVLGTCSRPDLKICLGYCRIAGAAAEALAEVLGRNKGPTKLFLCYIEYSILANGLRGNSRLRSLQPCSSSSHEVGNRQVLAITSALRENKGLIELNLNCCWVNDETWGAVCDSLKTHPTLEVLDLHVNFTNDTRVPAVITSRIQSLLDMMKVNISIHTIHLDTRYSQHEHFRQSVIPYLEMNQLRARVRAIQKSCPITLRAKLLGRALLSARTDANCFWMLLAGNQEVAFPSTIVTTTPAIVGLPTSVAAAATFTSNVAPFAPSNAAATRDTSAAGASTVAYANVAAPTACQKRKTCP
jgi:hypothetical protein